MNCNIPWVSAHFDIVANEQKGIKDVIAIARVGSRSEPSSSLSAYLATMLHFPQVCMTCIRCKSCGVTPGKTWDMAWNHEQDLCPDCTVLHNNGRKP